MSLARKPPMHAVAGIPITIVDTWATMAQKPIGGTGQFAAKSWSQMIDDELAVDGRIRFLEKAARQAIRSYRKIDSTARAGGVSVLPFEQHALLAIEELTRRRMDRFTKCCPEENP